MKFNIWHLLLITFLVAVFFVIYKAGWVVASPIPAVCVGSVFAWRAAGKRRSSYKNSAIAGSLAATLAAIAFFAFTVPMMGISSLPKYGWALSLEELCILCLVTALAGAIAGIITHDLQRTVHKWRNFGRDRP